MKAINIECDMCGETLRGYKGKAYISKDHIGIKGSVSVQLAAENGHEDHYFVTRNTHDEHHFCGWGCVRDFAEVRKNQYDRIRENALRREAGGGSALL